MPKEYMFFHTKIVGGAGSKINRSYKLLLQVILVWIAVSLLHFTEPTPNMVGMPLPLPPSPSNCFLALPFAPADKCDESSFGKSGWQTSAAWQEHKVQLRNSQKSNEMIELMDGLMDALIGCIFNFQLEFPKVFERWMTCLCECLQVVLNIHSG